MTTSYDEKREKLRNDLSNCVEQARELLNESIWGYTEMPEGYAFDVYTAVKKARDEI